MTTTITTHKVAAVEKYLQALDVASQHLPADERHEILASIRDHIDEELSDGPVSSDRVNAVLADVGAPESVIPQPDMVIAPQKPWLAWSAIAISIVGLFLAFALPPLGAVLSVAAIVIGWISVRSGERGLGRVALVVGGVGLLAAIVVALTLYSASTHPSSQNQDPRSAVTSAL